MRTVPSWALVLMLSVLVLVACARSEATPTPSPTPTATATPTATLTPGPVPTPCERRVGRDAEAFKQEVRSMELGFRPAPNQRDVPVEALMITGDLNIVDVQLVVQYRIEDLDAFVSNVDDPGDPDRDTGEGCSDGRTLRDAAEAAIRQVVGQRSMDDVLIVAKEAVQEQTKQLLQRILVDYETGIEILQVLLQTVRPPDQVRDAFDDVVRARVDRESRFNQALAYEQDQIPRAQGAAQQVIQAAEAFKVVRIIQAQEEAERFLTILTAYDKEGNETFKRLYLEAMEEVLPGISEFIVAVGSTANSAQASDPGGLLLSGSFLASGPTQQASLVLYREAGSLTTDLGRTVALASFNPKTPPVDRLLYIDVRPFSAPGRDGQFLEIDSYVRYRIVDPQKFRETLVDEVRAADRIGAIIIGELRAEIGLRTRAEIIGGRIEVDEEGRTVKDEEGRNVVRALTTPEGVPTREAITRLVRDRADQQVEDNNFGIEIVDVRIKRLDFPLAVEENVFARMRTEREVQAVRLRAEGEREYLTITADVDRPVAIIMAEAERAANRIRAEGEAGAIDIFIEVLAREPELSRYQRSLEAYKTSRLLAND